MFHVTCFSSFVSSSNCFSFSQTHAHMWVFSTQTQTPQARRRVQVDGCVWLVQAMIGINCHGRRHACLSHEVNSDWPDESRSCFWRSWGLRASRALPVLNSPHLSTLHPSDPLTARWRRDTSGHHAFAGVCRISEAVRWFPLRAPCDSCLPRAISLIVRRLLERKPSFPLLFPVVFRIFELFMKDGGLTQLCKNPFVYLTSPSVYAWKKQMNRKSCENESARINPFNPLVFKFKKSHFLIIITSEMLNFI